jgi:hypothetical protein
MNSGLIQVPTEDLYFLLIQTFDHCPKQLGINFLGFILHKNFSKLSQFYFQMAIDNWLALKLIQKNCINIPRIHSLFIWTKINRRNLIAYTTKNNDIIRIRNVGFVLFLVEKSLGKKNCLLDCLIACVSVLHWLIQK